MKTTATTLALIGLFAAAAAGGALAHEDYSESGSLHWLQHVMAQPVTPAAAGLARENPQGWDAGNPAEGVGGLALFEAMQTAAVRPRAQAGDATLDRGKDNHEEGIGGHGLYEAQRGR